MTLSKVALQFSGADLRPLNIKGRGKGKFEAATRGLFCFVYNFNFCSFCVDDTVEGCGWWLWLSRCEMMITTAIVCWSFDAQLPFQKIGLEFFKLSLWRLLTDRLYWFLIIIWRDLKHAILFLSLEHKSLWACAVNIMLISDKYFLVSFTNFNSWSWCRMISDLCFKNCASKHIKIEERISLIPLVSQSALKLSPRPVLWPINPIFHSYSFRQ